MRALAWLPVIACAQPPSVAAPGPASSAVHIDHVAHGLLPPVRVRGTDVRFAIEDRMRKYHIRGVSIAVFDHYQLAWAKAYGVADVETRQPVTETTLFQAGSISKSVNALAVLEAVANGKLALDAPINDSLASWKLGDNELTRTTPVTLRQLLSHTGGTTVHGFPGYVAGTPIPTVVQVLDGAPPANSPKIAVELAPGKQFSYSGGGVTITQLALVDQLHRPYPEILAASVLGPLGMTDSTYEQPLPPARVPQAAAGYTVDGTGVPGKRNVYPEMAAAGLWTTPSDLARFFIELQLARAGRSEKVAQAIATQMTTAVGPTDGDGQIGLGVFLSERNGARMFGHGGADTGFQADAVASLDHGYGMIAMANSDASFPLFMEIERAVFAEYGWDGMDTPIVRAALDPARLPRLAGHYGTTAQVIVVAVVGAKLQIHQPFREPAELVPVGGDAFVALDGGHFTLDGTTLTRSDARPARSSPRLADDARAPFIELEAGHFDAAVAAARELAAGQPEDDVNGYAYRVMIDGNAAGAVELFRLNAAVHPDSMNAHESLAEGYEAAGDTPHAIASYEAAIAAFDRDTTTPPQTKGLLRKTSTDAMRRLRTTR